MFFENNGSARRPILTAVPCGPRAHRPDPLTPAANQLGYVRRPSAVRLAPGAEKYLKQLVQEIGNGRARKAGLAHQCAGHGLRSGNAETPLAMRFAEVHEGQTICGRPQRFRQWEFARIRLISC